MSIAGSREESCLRYLLNVSLLLAPPLHEGSTSFKCEPPIPKDDFCQVWFHLAEQIKKRKSG